MNNSKNERMNKSIIEPAIPTFLRKPQMMQSDKDMKTKHAKTTGIFKIKIYACMH